MPSNILEKSMPFFSNLRKLVVVSAWRCQEFLAAVLTTATNLTHLTLDDLFEGQLPSTGMENLKELRLRSSSVKEKNLSAFLRNKSKLELLSCIVENDIDSVIDIVATHCPKLKAFADFYRHHPYRFHGGNSEDLKSRYSAIRYLDAVQELGRITYKRCGSDPSIQIFTENKSKSLKIYMNHDYGVMLEKQERTQHYHQSLTHFTSL